MNFAAKPYLLKNSVQNYEWGPKGENAFIPKLVGIKGEENTPYAELWIGAHPKAPSKVLIDENEIALDQLINQFPEEILGTEISKKFNGKLPFLLKVLSANQALSIQAHPNKQLAEVLHKRDSKNYPDDNHKPEISIAIDSLVALAGFKPVEEIIQVLEKYPVIKDCFSEETKEQIKKNKTDGLKEKIYTDIMAVSEDQLKTIIDGIIKIINQTENKNDAELLVIEQFGIYGYDVGILSILIFNLINLKSEEAIFTDAGIPHSYIKGNIVECMANSDNVIRAGLTPKFKDVKTLLEMIDYEYVPNVLIKKSGIEQYSYQTKCNEFVVTDIVLTNKQIKIENNNKIGIYLILEGQMELEYAGNLVSYKKGNVVMVPASLNSYTFSSNTSVKVIYVTVPI